MIQLQTCIVQTAKCQATTITSEFLLTQIILNTYKQLNYLQL